MSMMMMYLSSFSTRKQLDWCSATLLFSCSTHRSCTSSARIFSY